ncbi:calcium-binding protein [Roseomonas marmotae]|uniref:Calcium-binding protein n=1 Tax=Roseomonas marmotae TaxID=2768161 RepID=A0ABS3KF97_9PROT|nr:hypothetical protein [Roseomonas marmotae]MBO1075021.1 hypothetical protein [Roseomonas marmotae]QTI79943.1 hypothetical protein IAI58_03945 [Roseomonas marmotae]
MATPSAWGRMPYEVTNGFKIHANTADILESAPAVADNSGENFGIAYRSTTVPVAGQPAVQSIRFQAFDHVLGPLDEILPGPVTMDDGRGNILSGPSITGWGDGFAAVWQEQAAAGEPILLKARVTGPVGLVGGEFALSIPAGSLPNFRQHSVTLTPHEKILGPDPADPDRDLTAIGFTAVWVEEADGLPPTIRMQRFELVPNALGEPTAVAAAGADAEAGTTNDNGTTTIGQGINPSAVMLHDGEMAIIWTSADGQRLHGQVRSATDGQPMPPPALQLDAALAGHQIVPGHAPHLVSLGAGNFGVFWVAVKDGAAAPTDLVIKGQTYVLADGAATWVPGVIRTIVDLPEGSYNGQFNVTGLGEANEGGVVSFGTTDGRILMQSFDGNGVPPATPAYESVLDAAGGNGQHSLATLVSDRAVVVTQNEFGDLVAQMVDTRTPGQKIVGDRVRPDGRVDERPDLIVGTIGDDTVVADRGDTRNGRSDTDTVHAGMGNDILYGGGDNDLLDGGDGADVAAYRTSRERYSVTLNGDGSYTVRDMRLTNGGRDPGPDGEDRINAVEQLAFGATIGTAPAGDALSLQNTVRVSMDLFYQALPLPTPSVPEGTPQPWGLDSTGGFTVNVGPGLGDPTVGAQTSPIAVAMEESFGFVWQSGNNVYLKAYNPLGRHDPEFGDAQQIFKLDIDPQDVVEKQISGVAASMAGDLGVVAVWQQTDADGTAVIKGRHTAAVGGLSNSGAEFQVELTPGLLQRDAAVVGYEIVDAANDTVEFGFNVVYTAVSGSGASGQILLDRFVIPVDANGLEQAPVSRPVNDDDTGHFVIAEDGRDAAVTSLHDGELIISYVSGNQVKAAVLNPVTTGNVTTFEDMVTVDLANPIKAGTKVQVAGLTTGFLVAYQGEDGRVQAHVMTPGGENGWTATASIAQLTLPANATGVFHVSPTAEDDLGTGFVIYYEVPAGAGTSTVRGQVYGHDGQPIGGDFNVFMEDGSALSGAGFSAAGLGDGRLVIAGAGQSTDGLDTDGAIVARVLDTRIPGEQIIGPRDGAPRDLLVGTAGADALDGRENDDEVHGGLGNDFVIGGSGNDALFGEDGSDTLIGGSENDTLDGGAGDDVLMGGFGVDIMAGGEDTDTVSYQGEFASFSINLLEGNTRSNRNPANGLTTATLAIEDTFTGIENVIGGEVNDTITGDAASNSLSGRGGNDTIDGGNGDDALDGGDGNDTLNGGGGTDTISGGGGNDTIDGGEGTADRVQFSGTRAAYNVTYNAQTTVFTIAHLGGGEDGTDLVRGVEFFDFADGPVTAAALRNNTNPTPGTPQTIVGTAGADNLRGTAGNDKIIGLGGNDILSGLGGDDIIDGGAGADTLDGGAGDDFLNGGSGQDTLLGGGGNDTLNGGLAVDTLFGGAGVDILNGEDGNDRMFGEAGNDTLDGGLGADTMSGGLGNDIYIVDRAADIVSEFPDEGTDTVRSTVTYTLSANVENLQLQGDLNLNGTGNALANSITGNAGDNVLNGGAGNDTLTGDAGNDTLNGGAGADRMVGGTGDDLYVVDNIGDTVVEALGEGTDTIRVSVTVAGTTFALANTVENLTLVGSAALNGTGNASANVMIGNAGANTLLGLGGNDEIHGGGGADRLEGGAGNDVLGGDNGNDVIFGDAGSDIIIGGQGADTLTGGDGADFFTYTAFVAGRDTIADFIIGTDKIDLSAIDATLDGFNPVLDGTDGAFRFMGTQGFAGNGQGSVRYVANTGIVQIDAGDGGPAEMSIQVAAGTALGLTDFIL